MRSSCPLALLGALRVRRFSGCTTLRGPPPPKRVSSVQLPPRRGVVPDQQPPRVVDNPTVAPDAAVSTDSAALAQQRLSGTSAIVPDSTSAAILPAHLSNDATLVEIRRSRFRAVGLPRKFEEASRASLFFSWRG